MGMYIAYRWLKVIGALAVVFATLAFLENESANAQKQGGPIFITLNPATANRPFMPFAPGISALQTNGQQFGFNGITGSTNVGTGFAGGAAGLGGGGVAGLGGGPFGIRGVRGGVGGRLARR